jgi:hypothetical protein
VTEYKPNKRKAKQLGATYRKGYPDTYLKGQKEPRYRKSMQAQKKELDRLTASSGMPRNMALGILRKKYLKVGKEFKIK